MHIYGLVLQTMFFESLICSKCQTGSTVLFLYSSQQYRHLSYISYFSPLLESLPSPSHDELRHFIQAAAPYCVPWSKLAVHCIHRQVSLRSPSTVQHHPPSSPSSFTHVFPFLNTISIICNSCIGLMYSLLYSSGSR